MRRRTRQRMVRGALYLLFVVLAVAVALVVDWEAVSRNFLQWDIAREMVPKVLTIAARNTFLYTVFAFVGGVLLGLMLALMKMSPVAPYRWVANVYVEVFRGLPALLTIIFFAFAFPIAFRGLRIPGGTVGAAVFALTLVAAAYLAETIRAGIEAVPKGQVEAARSLGMSPGRTMVSIVIPQAFRIIVPPMTNEFVLLIKDTALIFVAGSQPAQEELTKFGRDLLFTNANATPLVVVGAVYLLITIPLTRLSALIERRNRMAR